MADVGCCSAFVSLLEKLGHEKSRFDAGWRGRLVPEMGCVHMQVGVRLSVGATEVCRLPQIRGARAVLQVRHNGFPVAWSDEKREGVSQRIRSRGAEESCKDALQTKNGRGEPRARLFEAAASEMGTPCTAFCMFFTAGMAHLRLWLTEGEIAGSRWSHVRGRHGGLTIT